MAPIEVIETDSKPTANHCSNAFISIFRALQKLFERQRHRDKFPKYLLINELCR
jgi:hypothetical protein